MGRGVVLVGALLCAALASACTPSDPPAQSPTPAPSPTFSCSTATVSDPCTAEKAQKEKEQAADYQQIEAAYRAFVVERNRLIHAGGADSPSSTMSSYAAGPYLGAMSRYLREQSARKLKVSGSIVVAKVTPAPSVSRADAPEGERTVIFCEDSREVTIVSPDGRKTHGVVLGGEMFARQISGQWKIWDTKDRQVDSCADVS